MLSSARRNPGAEKELNKETNFADDPTDRFFRYGDTLVIISIRAGYKVDNAPRVVAIRLYIDWQISIIKLAHMLH